MAAPKNSSPIWPTWLRLYFLYAEIAREWVIEWQSCPGLDQRLDSPPDEEVIAETGRWFAQMDGRIEVQHLRQFAQNSPLMTEDAITDFLVHYLHKQPHSEAERDKVDFLVVQLFSAKAPHCRDADLSLGAVARILEPVLGPQEGSGAAFLAPLDELIEEAGRTKTLKALFTSRLIERGRDVKARCGEHFFDPLSLAAFARFGFFVRRTFFRLMRLDFDAILDGLRELEENDVRTLDCRKAQFARDESVARVRVLCQSWRVMFQAEYSSGQPLCLLVDLRTAVETAVENLKVGGGKAPSGLRAEAAPAGTAPANQAGTRNLRQIPVPTSARDPKPALPK